MLLCGLNKNKVLEFTSKEIAIIVIKIMTILLGSITFFTCYASVIVDMFFSCSWHHEIASSSERPSCNYVGGLYDWFALTDDLKRLDIN